MAIGTRTLLALTAVTPMLLSACTATGASTPSFESNMSFTLMLYG